MSKKQISQIGIFAARPRDRETCGQSGQSAPGSQPCRRTSHKIMCALQVAAAEEKRVSRLYRAGPALRQSSSPADRQGWRKSIPGMSSQWTGTTCWPAKYTCRDEQGIPGRKNNKRPVRQRGCPKRWRRMPSSNPLNGCLRPSEVYRERKK